MNDDVVSEPPPQYQDHPLLRRRNSLSSSTVVVPTKLTLLPTSTSSSTTTTTAATSSSSSFPSDVDLELVSIKPTSSHSYTSLKDLLPSAAVYSPKPSSAHQQAQPGSDICIRNRLVKQAAWAYLQPMSTSPGAAGDGFLRRFWPPVAAFFDFVRRGVIRALDWTLRVIWTRSSR